MIEAIIGSNEFRETDKIRVTIWNEYVSEKTKPEAAAVYPHGIHHALAEGLAPYGFLIRTATLEQPEHGLTEQVLRHTDVLIWWGHMAHDLVKDEIVERVYQRVLEGMGLIVLHSGHFSKLFRKLMGTTCNLKWREAKERELLWVVNPAHPITAGLGEYIQLQEEEMYGEFFDIPAPDELIFVGWFQGGQVFRSGCTFYRRLGKIFYFQPGHESYPAYYNEQIMRVIANAVKWAALAHGAAPVFGFTPK
ncbi:ThuA domain-containing protein [Paenibacillus sp. HN-1]|uniref:ThuA domain-containing protein n=1 Tax=Paenibacillus TaxID=44249 RepID=UPI001CA9145A|nr:MULTISPECIES: ThuA domain-containing protein [Paenibacillus]MBY9080704.1 ThuA domain-containing protein [Paenibacillus sp. CGMCC 1.18879]MBY9085351.1 ThuA domain-containing protein [Paenibacillus sinensis]